MWKYNLQLIKTLQIYTGILEQYVLAKSFVSYKLFQLLRSSKNVVSLISLKYLTSYTHENFNLYEFVLSITCLCFC